MNVRTLASAALILVFTAAARPAGEDIVEIRVRGRFFAEPATVRVTVAVQPAPENRSLIVQADGQSLFRSTEVALEGEHGRRLHVVEFKNLPAGEYTLRAEVHTNANMRGAAEEHVVVGVANAELARRN